MNWIKFCPECGGAASTDGYTHYSECPRLKLMASDLHLQAIIDTGAGARLEAALARIRDLETQLAAREQELQAAADILQSALPIGQIKAIGLKKVAAATRELVQQLAAARAEVERVQCPSWIADGKTCAEAPKVRDIISERASLAREVERLTRERDEAREALRYYADRNNWQPSITDGGYELVYWLPNVPGWSKADEALATQESK
jgi:DNA repair exonuclease SbcCD ATPase subunit